MSFSILFSYTMIFIRNDQHIWWFTKITFFLIILIQFTVPATFYSTSILWIASTSWVKQNSFIATFTFSSFRINLCTIFLLYFNTFTTISGYSISKCTLSTHSIRFIGQTIVYLLGWFCTYFSGDTKVWFLASYARTKQTK